MGAVTRAIHVADGYQRQRAWLALPVAVTRKFVDNRAWTLAALVAYYSFIALFPLLLVLTTLLTIVLHNDAALRARVLKSALAHYPVIGQQLQDNLAPLKQTGAALVVGIIVMLFGARGVTSAMQNAVNSAWEVPRTRRLKWPVSWLRGLAMLVVIGIGLIVTSVLSGLAGGAGDILAGLAAAGTWAISLALNIGMFWLSFRLAAADGIGWRKLLPAALLSAVAWQIMQAAGSYLVTHQIARSSNLYGVFAIVLGLLGWLYAEALLTVAALEISAVLGYRLWPRSLAAPAAAADRLAFRLYAEVENRGETQLIITTDVVSSFAALASVACLACAGSLVPDSM